jgi:hypothetical protein
MAKQLNADKSSNAARNTTDNGAKSEGSIEELGYMIEAYPSEGPAENNGEIKSTTSGGVFDGPIPGGQLGTSIDSYNHQDEKVDAETGKGRK